MAVQGSKFKKGEKVRYVGNNSTYFNRIFTIISRSNSIGQYEVKETNGFTPFERNLRKLTKLEKALK